MIRLTELAQRFVRERLRPDDAAVDATVGNGHDTRFLAGLCARVYGFDVQRGALATVAEVPNVTPVLADHARMAEFVPPGVGAVMFNLGYRPGGDKRVTTAAASSLPAMDAALSLLRAGGGLTVIAYRGHPGGREEADAVRGLLGELPADGFAVTETPGSEAAVSPVLFAVRKRIAGSTASGPA